MTEELTILMAKAKMVCDRSTDYPNDYHEKCSQHETVTLCVNQRWSKPVTVKYKLI